MTEYKGFFFVLCQNYVKTKVMRFYQVLLEFFSMSSFSAFAQQSCWTNLNTQNSGIPLAECSEVAVLPNRLNNSALNELFINSSSLDAYTIELNDGERLLKTDFNIE